MRYEFNDGFAALAYYVVQCRRGERRRLACGLSTAAPTNMKGKHIE